MAFGLMFRSPRHPAVGPPKLLTWSRRQSYWRATRHPLACLLFLLPLLLAYEVGVLRLGAGIYEEALFRLALFGGLFAVLRLLPIPQFVALGLAALAASVAFSAVHHAGPYGEPLTPFVFVFRTFAGLYFTALFLLRGYGVA